MKPEILAQIEIAIQAQQAKGIKLAPTLLGVIHRSNAYYSTDADPEWLHGNAYHTTEHKCACALGCFLLENQPKPREGCGSAYQTLAELWEVSPYEIDLFTQGFDGLPVRCLADCSGLPWYRAGRDLARRYLK